MKTLKTVVRTIQELQNRDYSMFDSTLSEKQKKKDRRELIFLNVIKKYLMTQPTQEFCSSERDRLEKIINAVMGRFVEPENVTKGELSKLRKVHEKEYDVAKYRRQLRTMYYILN